MSRSTKILTAPSILSADFTKIEEAVQLIEECGGDMVHMDVMDGVFVPPITFGCQMVQAVNKSTDLPLDVHLMVANPQDHIDCFIDSGADYLTFHYEAAVHHHRLIQRIKNKGCKAGISIVPSTPVSVLEELLPHLDLVLIMSVNPGYGGQKLISTVLQKIEKLKSIKETFGYGYLTSIDGGVNRETIDSVLDSGAELIVAGSAFFNSKNPAEELKLLRGE